MRISDWSSDVCSSDLSPGAVCRGRGHRTREDRGRRVPAVRRGRVDHGHVDIAQHNVGDVYQWCGRQLAKIAGGAGDILDHQRADDMRRRRGRNVDVMVDFHPWQLLKGAALSTLLGVSRSEEHTSELQSLMRISYAVFC